MPRCPVCRQDFRDWCEFDTHWQTHNTGLYLDTGKRMLTSLRQAGLSPEQMQTRWREMDRDNRREAWSRHMKAVHAIGIERARERCEEPPFWRGEPGFASSLFWNGERWVDTDDVFSTDDMLQVDFR